MLSPFTVEVYDKSFGYCCSINAPLSFVPTPRHLAQPTAALALALTALDDDVQYALNEAHAALKQPGARILSTYHGTHIMSGWVTSYEEIGSAFGGTVTYQITDDYTLVNDMVVWPNPTAALTAQTGVTRVITGPAETVVKTAAAECATRLGLPLTVAANLGRGATITGDWRFEPLMDPILQQLFDAGIGVTVRQVGVGLVLDVYQSRAYPSPLTVASGVVQEYRLTSSAPTSTRYVVGGQGEKDVRILGAAVESTRETLWGRKIERFLDATDVNVIGDLPARGTKALIEGDRHAGISLTLNQTGDFRYDPAGGDGYRVGDTVTVELRPGVTETLPLSETTLSFTAASGVTESPVAGENATVERRLIRTIDRLAASVRKTSSRR